MTTPKEKAQAYWEANFEFIRENLIAAEDIAKAAYLRGYNDGLNPDHYLDPGTPPGKEGE